MSYASEITADSPAVWARLGETSGTAAIDQVGGASGTYAGGYTLAQSSLLASDSDPAVLLTAASLGDIMFAARVAFDVGDIFTIEAWVKLTSVGAVQTIFGKGANAPILRFTSSGNLLLRKNSVGDIATTTTTFITGTVYHVVATKSAAAVHLYVNGVDVTGAVTNQTCANTADNVHVGSAAGSDYLNGILDEFAIYPTALSAGRVLAHYSASVRVTRRRMLLLGVG